MTMGKTKCTNKCVFDILNIFLAIIELSKNALCRSLSLSLNLCFTCALSLLVGALFRICLYMGTTKCVYL